MRILLIPLIVNFFSFLSLNGQVYTKKQYIMDTIYTQHHGKNILIFVRESDNEKVKWKAILRNAENNELVLLSDSIKKNMAWKHHEHVGESPIDLFNITGSYIDGNSLYILYNQFGNIYITKYIINQGDNFKEEKIIIDEYMVSGGFGKMINKAIIKKIKHNLFINLLVGQDGIGVKQNLYKLELERFNIKKLHFQENTKKIKVLYVTEVGKRKYRQKNDHINRYTNLTSKERQIENYRKPTEEEIEEVEILKHYIDIPFFYKQVSTSPEKEQEEMAEIHNLGLDWYKLFSKEEDSNLFSFGNKNADFCPIDEKKVANADQFLRKLNTEFGFLNSESQNLTIIDYIYQNSSEFMIFFFYTDKFNNEKIIRYDNYKNEWLIGDYSEEEIKQE